MKPQATNHFTCFVLTTFLSVILLSFIVPSTLSCGKTTRSRRLRLIPKEKRSSKAGRPFSKRVPEPSGETTRRDFITRFSTKFPALPILLQSGPSFSEGWRLRSLCGFSGRDLPSRESSSANQLIHQLKILFPIVGLHIVFPCADVITDGSADRLPDGRQAID